MLEEYDDIWLRGSAAHDELIYSAALMDGILCAHNMCDGYWVALIGQGVDKIKV